MDLKKMIAEQIRALLAEQLDAAVAEALTTENAALQSDDDSEPTVAQLQRQLKAARTGAAAPAAAKRAGTRLQLKKEYVLVPIKASASAAAKTQRQKTLKALTPALREVWETMTKVRQPMTARALMEALDGRSDKSIQSALHSLRTLGLVESRPLGGKQ